MTRYQTARCCPTMLFSREFAAQSPKAARTQREKPLLMKVRCNPLYYGLLPHRWTSSFGSPGQVCAGVFGGVSGYMRVRRLSLRTEESYLYYVRRYLEFHKRRPEEMGEAEVEAFLTHLAGEMRVAASTQNLAFASLIYLYREILGIELENVSALRAKRARRAPDVLGRDEVRRLLAQLKPPHHLIASLLYGAGLSLFEGQRLRVKDVDFEGGILLIRAGKGGKDRPAVLPQTLYRPLYDHLEAARQAWNCAQSERNLPVSMPDALARKYPQAPFEWGWQYLFSASKSSLDPLDGAEKRHHFLEDSLQRALKRAALKTTISKRVSPHVSRHSFPRICSKADATSAPSRICWATKTFAPRGFICTP